jgi:hypothetical protein
MADNGVLSLDDDEIESPARVRTVRRVTKIEWGLLFGIIIQVIALVWGAAKLSVGVENLNKNMDKMSDYSVLRYRVDKLEDSARELKVATQQILYELQKRR